MSEPRLWARTLRGLEGVAAAEISYQVDATINRVVDRGVLFEVPSYGPRLLRLRCCDDLFIVAGEATGVGHHRADLADLEPIVEPAGVAMAVLARSELTRTPPGPIAVVASVVGRHNYSRFDIEDVVGTCLAAVRGQRYVSRRSSRPPVGAESWRLVLDNGRGWLGLRLGWVPLHRREYRLQPGPGALHPPLAAAAALLAGLHPGQLLVDPCCGSATIAIEAKLLTGGLRAVAADVNVAGLSAARANVVRAGVNVPLLGVDAAHLPFPHGSTHRIVTNPPWGRQVSWAHGPTSHAPLWLAISDALRQDGRAAVITDCPERHLEVVERAALSAVLFGPISLSGSLVSVLIAGRDRPLLVDHDGLAGPELRQWALNAPKPHSRP